MARDMVEVMQALGFERFAVVGHDRGGRCAYRMALDHPERIAALSVLDIIPTAEHFQRTDMSFAMGYWHWFFLAQPHPIPERLIASDPDVFYLRRGRALFDEEALAEYRRCYTDPATIHAMCEDYRAGATIDMRLDEEDQKAGTADRLPGAGAVGAGRTASIDGTTCSAVWRDWADRVEGHSIDCGHYLAEEAPEETLAALEPFLARAFMS